MIILADKPSWRTSNDIVQYIKHQTHSKKCGHAGTLDPMATGLMILATDDDTKQLHTFVGYDKRYEATIDLSQSTDTRDQEYREFHQSYPLYEWWLLIDWIQRAWPSIDDIKVHIDRLSVNKWYVLPIPPFSAKKINGKKRYDMARSWDQPIIDQSMNIYHINLLEYLPPLIRLSCHVGSGTYIRSIAYRLGMQLQTWWILTSLVRTHVGIFSLDDIKDNNTSSKVSYQIIKNLP